jgi:hypothetical protein
LAAELGVEERTTRRYLEELESFGLIVSDQQGLGKPNVYKFKWHQIFGGDSNHHPPGGGTKLSGLDRTNTPDGPDTSDRSERTVLSGPINEVGKDSYEKNKTLRARVLSKRTNLSYSTNTEEYVKEEVLSPLYPPLIPNSIASNKAHAGARDIDEDYAIDIDDYPDVFIRNVYRRERGIQKWANPSSRKKQLAQKFGENEASYGKDEYRKAFICFIRTDDQWLRENGWPLPCFFKHPEKWDVVNGQPHQNQRRTAIQAQQPIEKPSPISKHPPTAESDYAWVFEQWNQLVKSSPVNWSSGQDPDKRLREVASDPEFKAGFETICRKAAQIRAANQETGWLTFRWLLGYGKTGTANWWRVLSGEFDWLAKRNGDKHKSVTEETLELIHQEELSEQPKIKTVSASGRD